MKMINLHVVNLTLLGLEHFNKEKFMLLFAFTEDFAYPFLTLM